MNTWMITAENSWAVTGAPFGFVLPTNFGSRPSWAISMIGSAHSICQET